MNSRIFPAPSPALSSSAMAFLRYDFTPTKNSFRTKPFWQFC